MTRIVAIAALAALLIGLTGCTATPAGGEPSASAEPSAVATMPEVSPSVTPSPVPMPANPEFRCALDFQSDGDDGHAHLTDITVSSEDGFDRITFTYIEDSIPGWVVESAHAPFVDDPRGQPMDVAGTSVYLITIRGGTSQADDGTSTYDGPHNFEPGYEQIVQLVERGDFEATNSWYLGLNGGECLRAFTLTNPTRIVIDVQH